MGYDTERKEICIECEQTGGSVVISEREYRAIQKITNGNFEDFYDSGKIEITDGYVSSLDLSSLELNVLDPCISDLSSLQILDVGTTSLFDKSSMGLLDVLERKGVAVYHPFLCLVGL